MLISDAVLAICDDEIWREDQEREAEGRKALGLIAERWDDLAAYIEETRP